MAMVWVVWLRLLPSLEKQVAGLKVVTIARWASGLGLCRRVEVSCSARIAGCS